MRISRHGSEAAENELLLQSIGETPGRIQFCRTLDAYERADERARLRLIEAVIRTSRGVSGDAARLSREHARIVLGIAERYRMYAGVAEIGYPQTFAQARDILARLFF